MNAETIYQWAFPPESDKEDARDRIKADEARVAGERVKKPRDWEPTREFARECARKYHG